MLTTKKLPKVGLKTVWVVSRDGVEVGVVTKFASNRTTWSSYCALKGVGYDQTVAGNFFDAAEGAKRGFYPTGEEKLGGFKAAVEAAGT